MKKRVNKSRFGISLAAVAMLVLLVCTSVPALARQEMSAGQAGDPGDGEEVFSGGSAGDSQAAESQTVKGTGRDMGLVLLIPVFVPGLHLVQLAFVAIKFRAGS